MYSQGKSALINFVQVSIIKKKKIENNHIRYVPSPAAENAKSVEEN